jgi:hypothetical protein
LEVAGRLRQPERIADSQRNIATALFGRGFNAEGLGFLQAAEEAYKRYLAPVHSYIWDMGLPPEDAEAKGGIPPACAMSNLTKVGRTYLALGRRERAAELISECLEYIRRPTVEWQMFFLMALAGLEEALGSPGFSSYCRTYRDRYSEAANTPFQQWYLEAAEIDTHCNHCRRMDFGNTLPQGWTWHDPCGDGSYSLEGALVVRAANGRAMWCRNMSAPRITRRVDGDFALEGCCGPALADQPHMGGLLLWQDADNFLQVERGRMGVHQLTFRGRVEGMDIIVGRGMVERDRVHLRLERRIDRVRALCSPDGEAWYTLGTTEAGFGESVQVGLLATGFIVRDYYLGAFPDGTAIRFEDFRLWQ